MEATDSRGVMTSKSHHLVVATFLWTSLCGVWHLAWGGNGNIPNEGSPVELDAATLNWSAIVLKEFQSTHKSWRCFSVSMYFSEGNWRVDFLPKNDVRDSGKELIVGDSKPLGSCSRGTRWL